MKIWVSIAAQRLTLIAAARTIVSYPVSTASAGPGQRNGSFGTPLGRHIVRAKIGAKVPAGGVFVGRRPTGEVWTPELHRAHPDRDWILTRILWLSGTQPGYNRLGDVDTMRRYIYIHGAPPVASLGVPESHGCIRMSNAAVIDLFDRVPLYAEVEIVEAEIP